MEIICNGSSVGTVVVTFLWSMVPYRSSAEARNEEMNTQINLLAFLRVFESPHKCLLIVYFILRVKTGI